MKLRTKLFLSIGVLFLVFAVAALFLENYLVQSHLDRSEKAFVAKIYQQHKENKKRLEGFLAELLSADEGKIDAFLEEENFYKKRRVWIALTNLLSSHKWIDFLSLTAKDKEYALIPSRASIYPFTVENYKSAYKIHTSRGIYLARKITSAMQSRVDLKGEIEDSYLLIRKISGKKREKRKEIYPEWKPPMQAMEKSPYKQAFTSAYKISRMKDAITWLSSILAHFLDNERAPLGIAYMKKGKEGGVLFAEDLFFTEEKSHLPSFKEKYEIFTYPKAADFFLGSSYKKNGYTITVGKVVSDMAKDLSIITGEEVFVKHNDKTLSAKDGKLMELPSPDFPDKDVGDVELHGKQLFFTRLMPFSDAELSFYLVQKKSKAFAIIDFIKKQTQVVIRNITWNMRIMGLVALVCALFILHRIASRITKPIAMVARATKEVVNGHYEKAKLPKKVSSDEIGVLVKSFSDMVKGLKEREHVQGTLNKVVSKEIAEKLLKEEIHLGGVEKEGIILFADIRDFTSITENMDPQNVISFLNGCMTKISHVIDLHHGVIDKYVGDEVMALFGIPVASKNDHIEALKCAVEMQQEINKWNEERKSNNLFPVEIGIGVHRGKVVAGNMGSENRLNYTVVGAEVNLASRLCSAAKGGEILISGSLAKDEQVQKTFTIKELEAVSLKGFTDKVAVYQILEKNV